VPYPIQIVALFERILGGQPNRVLRCACVFDKLAQFPWVPHRRISDRTPQINDALPSLCEIVPNPLEDLTDLI
jgi:hypothetical protein